MTPAGSQEPFNETQAAGVLPHVPYLLEVEGVRKAFPGVVALDGVRLQIRPGSVHALMGENGAGKSTLMKIIAGIYQPDTGEIRLKGKPVKLTTPLAALDAGIAMKMSKTVAPASVDDPTSPPTPSRALTVAPARRGLGSVTKPPGLTV